MLRDVQATITFLRKINYFIDYEAPFRSAGVFELSNIRRMVSFSILSLSTASNCKVVFIQRACHRKNQCLPTRDWRLEFFLSVEWHWSFQAPLLEAWLSAPGPVFNQRFAIRKKKPSHKHCLLFTPLWTSLLLRKSLKLPPHFSPYLQTDGWTLLS